jgi:hypothetical protein
VEAKRRGRFAARALKGEQPTKKRRTLLWSLIGVIGGLGAGLIVSRRRAEQSTITPAWTNMPATGPTPTSNVNTDSHVNTATKPDTTPEDETAPAFQDRLG